MKSLYRLSSLFLALTVVVALAGCTDPTADVNKAGVSEAVPEDTTPATAEPAAGETPAATETAAPAPTEGAKTYTITENSSILFTGYKVGGEHSGGFAIFEGTCETPTGDLKDLKVTVEIDATSLFSDDTTLTDVLKGEGFFEIAKFPSASFHSTKVEKGTEPDQYTVTGNLEMVGIAKSVTFPATIKTDGDILTTQAEFTIPRSTWNLTYNGPFADTLIKEDVLIKFDVEAEAK